ncbi:MAG: methyltransferase domain-containing protein [bacterium]
MAVTFNRIPETSDEIKCFYRLGDFPWHDHHSHADDPLHSEKNRIIEEAIELLKPGSLIDIGCGSGKLLYAVSPFVKTLAVGLDISEKGFSSCCGDIVAVCGDAERLPIGDNRFECVVCSDVLEHLPNPETALSEIGRILLPEGHLIATVPNMFCLDSFEGKTHLIESTIKSANRLGKMLGLDEIFPAGWNTHIHKKIVREWKYIINNAGFVVIDDKPIYLFPYIPYFMQRLKKIECNIWRYSIVRRINSFSGRVTSLAKLGQLHFFLCRKH